MAEKIVKSSDERGALMLEAIALLGLMTMMSPMVVRQTADRTSEMEEVAVAGQMKTLRDAVSSYIDANYANIAAWASGTDAQTLPLNDLRPYLPPAFFQDDGTLGNKLIDNYQVGIRRERPCADLTKDECNRWKITGLISSMGEELDDRRAARIATMVGADGGYIRSTQALNALFPGNEAEAKKAIGAQGIWEIDDVTQFFPGGNVGKGRVVATTTYTSGLGGDFLYRHAVNSLPEANSMFTDIDMSGMGSGAHRIRHSGGLEVVNGKIIVRDSRNTDWDADAATTISNKELTMTDADVLITKNNTEFSLGDGEVSAQVGANSAMEITGSSALLKGGAGKVEVNNTEARIEGGHLAMVGNTSATLSTGGQYTQQVQGNFSGYTGGTHTLTSTGNMSVTSNGTVSIGAAGDATIWSNSDARVAGSSQASLTAGGSDPSVDSDYGLVVKNGKSTATGFDNTANRIIGGLTVKDNRITLLDSSNTVRARLEGLSSTMFSMYTPDSKLLAEMGVGGSGYLSFGNQYRVVEASNPVGTGVAGIDGSDAEVFGSHFTPQYVATDTSNTSFGYPVRNFVRASYTNMGVNNAMTPTSQNSQTIPNQLSDDGGIASKLYGGNTVSERINGRNVRYDRYEVDPAFVSVMNDIKLTSRGGAHLADILPNYINKGIYVLSNTYASGPWPCDSSTCSFTIPRLEKTDGSAITTGAWENDCDTMDDYLGTGASCHDDGAHGMRVSYYSSGSYNSCGSGACLTHPYLGVVPAPGHTVTVAGDTTISGKDEGPCPDGYLPVMTVTPTAIEVGKVNHIDMRVSMGGTEEDSYVYYNLENIDFAGNRASIYQPATAVSTAVLTVDGSGNPVGESGEVYGWKVALGTISTTSSGYVWNQGGVWQDSMKAVAHTYCYFNPSRFTFPNMVVDNGLLHAMPSPRKY